MKKKYTSPHMRSKEYVCDTFITGSLVDTDPDLEDDDNWVKNPNPV